MVDENKEQTPEEIQINLLTAWGDLFHQLMQFERFQRFVACNYDIKIVKDEEIKEVRTVVMEVPDDEVQARLIQLFSTPEGEVEIHVPSAADLKNLKL